MKLDAHPKSMALIMFSLGVCITGIILLATFFDETTMLGVGIALAILGAAGAIFGCIHRTTKGEYSSKASRGDGKPASDVIAPERIPSPSIIMDRDRSFDAGGTLHYEPCSVSPPRPHRNGDGLLMSPPGGAIVPMDFEMQQGGVMSPYAERTFPVPMSPGARPVNRNPAAFVVPKEWETPIRQPPPSHGGGSAARQGQWSPAH